MEQSSQKQQSRLIGVLREGITLIQMIFFREMKDRFDHVLLHLQPAVRSRLAGAVTNNVFGTPNPDPEFTRFSREHQSVIEQELLGIADNLPHLLPFLTDALRLQELCDHQDGVSGNDTLITADKLGILIHDRDIPLPSVFMTTVRALGARYGLIVPPAPVLPEDDQTIVH